MTKQSDPVLLGQQKRLKLDKIRNMDFMELLYLLIGDRIHLLAGLLFPTEARRRFYKDLAHLLRSGLRFREVFGELINVYPGLSLVFSGIARKIDMGFDPASAMEGWVPAGERMLIRAAEQSGKSENVTSMLNRLVENMDMTKKIQSAFFDAMLQPVLLFYSTIAMFVYMSDVILKQMFANMHVSPEHLIGPARVYYGIFSFVGSSTGMLTIAFVTLGIPAIIFVTIQRDWPGRKYFDRAPPWSLYRLIVGAGFLYSLAALTRSGLTAKNALLEVHKQSHGWLNARVENAIKNLGIDGLLSTALSVDGYQFPDKEIIQRLKLRESRGSLSQALHEFSQDWTDDSIEQIKKQTSILNFVAMTTVGSMAYLMTVGMQAISNAANATMGLMH